MNITPQQFYKQWLRLGPAAATVSHFDRQVHDFTFTAGRVSKDRFQQSFTQGGFYGSGQRWPERTSRWGRRFHHPVMNHTGLLKAAIDGDSFSDKVSRKPAPGRKAAFRRHTTYTLVAAPESVAMRGVRGVRKDGAPTTYAAVHNAPPTEFGHWSNQHRKSRPVQRQFMGLNKKLDAEIARYYNTIFNGLPGVGNSPSL
jgi:hypothetical protein